MGPAFKNLPEPKDQYWVEGAGHCDLYDDKTKILFEKIGDFFKKAFV